MDIGCNFCKKKSVSGLLCVTMQGTSREAVLSAREHIRFWSFVKEFHELSECRMSVTIFIGKGLCPKIWRKYCERSLEMMNLCVKQYDVHFETNTIEILNFIPQIDATTFIRPDDFIEPMYNLLNDK